MQQEPDYSYLDLLNPQQRAAVEYKDGPALVIAGAGSGKTRVLTYKIVDLIRHRYEPYRIMALTFTNKAAREMKERIRAIVGDKTASQLWMGTFHSIFLRILRRHADLLGFKSNFTIYDATDSKSLVKMIIRDLDLDDKIYRPAVVASAISNAKNSLIGAQAYVADRSNYEADRRSKRPMIGEIYRIYSERCRLADAMDFDDILYYMNVLLRDNPDILRHYQDFFRYILVDEYQDTNFAQHLIVSMLSGDRRALCVVGDDAQSIYSFRGANISNILGMERNFPGLKIFKLERNYRSTQNIINAAGSLIAKNTRQMPKNVYSENAVGDPVTVMSTYSDIEEAYMVANLISQTKYTAHDSYDEYAVLYRTNAQSRVLEESLRKRNIPYRIFGGLSFYQRKEVKDAICYFRLAVNPDDDEALRRVINYPARGIGETTVKKLISAATESHVSIWGVLSDPQKYGLNVNSGTLRKLNDFKSMISAFVDDVAAGKNAFETAQLIYNRSGMISVLAHDNTPEAISRQENLSELLSGLKDFVETRMEAGESEVGLSAFLSEVSLATDQDSDDDVEGPKVTLMTAHAAKGLEFKHIFIVGVEEELFPSAMSMDSMDQVEEERRLLYVAITRAKETCVMSYASSRFRNGQTVMTSPSRFLREIDTRYLQMRTSRDDLHGSSDSFGGSANRFGGNANRFGGSAERFGGRGSYSSSESRSSSSKIKLGGFSSTASADTQQLEQTADGTLRIGSVISHPRFGQGVIKSIENASGNELVMADFGVVGVKKLLLRFAKITIVTR